MQLTGLLIMLCCVSIAAGCSTPSKELPHAVETVALSEQGSTQIARDVVAMLKSVSPPASTTIVLTSLARAMVLGHALDAQLRTAGYAITTDTAQPKGLRVGYTLDSLGGDEVRIDLTAGESLRLGRLYYRTPAGTLEARTGFCGWMDPIHREGAALRQEIAQAPGPEWKPTLAPFARQGQFMPAMDRSREVAAADDAEVGNCSAAEQISDPPEPPEGSPVQQVCPNASEETLVLEPNSDRVIEISPALFGVTDVIPNPFVQYYQPKVLANETRILVGGVVLGPHPNAVLNGKVWSVGESFEGFRVQAVAQEYVTVTRDMFVLRLPVSARETIVKYP